MEKAVVMVYNKPLYFAGAREDPDEFILMEVYEMAKKESRFEIVFKDGAQLKDDGLRQILVDTETGVNYLVWKSGYAGGITPLLDSDGKVIITDIG
jgi:hypothetical protein